MIQNNIDEIKGACKQHHVETLSFFGSAAKNVMLENSDIDLLVAFSDDIDILDYADNYFSLLDKNPVLKVEVYQTKVELYAA